MSMELYSRVPVDGRSMLASEWRTDVARLSQSTQQSGNLNSLSLLVVGSASYLFLGGEAHKAFLVECQLILVGGEVQKL